MSEKGKGKYDIVEDVLKKGSKKVTPKETEAALKAFNDMTQELESLRTLSSNQSECKKQIDKLKQENRKLMEESAILRMQRDEFRNRFSSIAGQKLTEGYSDIEILSDPFRPTNLAEHFSQVYDDIWTQAYETLHNNASIEEQKIIDFLAEIIKNVDGMCLKTSVDQISKLGHYIADELVCPKLMTDMGTFVASSTSVMKMEEKQKERVYKLLKEFRKSFATYAPRPLFEIFEKCYMKKIQQAWNISYYNADIRSFVSKCVEIIWLMKIQSPPMELLWQQGGDPCDKERFTFYTKKGEKVERCVWPAVMLHAGNGPLLSKGVIQGI